jgi:5-methylcytosine-specific restriction enzyme B
LKRIKSWSKLNEQKELIATKKVDWSTFRYGSHIPRDFHEDFEMANNNFHLNRGEKHKVELIIKGKPYEAQLVNLARSSSNSDSIQLRYDQNKELKNLLTNIFNNSYQYLTNKKDNEEGKGRSGEICEVPENIAEYIEFYQTEKPFVYRVELIQSKFIENRTNYWWVNQGKSAKLQTAGGFLWSPKSDKNGIPLSHHNDIKYAKPGDIIFAYSNSAIRSICIVEKKSEDKQKPSSFSDHKNWEAEGNYLKVTFYSLNSIIGKTDIPEDWRINEAGPFDRNGNVKQGYFYKISNSFSSKLLKEFKERVPHNILEKSRLFEGERSEYMKFFSDQSLIDHIYSYIKNKGFFYDKKDIINLYLSLRTKPFVLLSGISGTGKTKIVQLLAESLGATAENLQFALIPVRPDWSDGSDLIGYRDIKGEFQAGPLTRILMEANQPENHNKPYFLLLDEMNLARVEYYFSDLLSVMESRDRQNGEMVSAPVVEEEEVGRLLLRDNFYIIGTVNMDETTHPFSPKVLDRANTIEYNDVVLDHFGFLTNDSIAEPVAIDNQQIAGRFLNLKDAFFDHEELVRKVTGLLVEVNTILEPIKAHFGYRVRDEVCFYMIYNNEGQLMEFDDAFDYQLLQKVLPRLTGNDLKTEEALKKLFLFCASHEWDEMSVSLIVKEARFSKSAEKLSKMISKIVHDGFTSFWGS